MQEVITVTLTQIGEVTKPLSFSRAKCYASFTSVEQHPCLPIQETPNIGTMQADSIHHRHFRSLFNTRQQHSFPHQTPPMCPIFSKSKYMSLAALRHHQHSQHSPLKQNDRSLLPPPHFPSMLRQTATKGRATRPTHLPFASQDILQVHCPKPFYDLCSNFQTWV